MKVESIDDSNDFQTVCKAIQVLGFTPIEIQVPLVITVTSPLHHC